MMKTEADYQERILKALKELPVSSLPSVLDFIEYVKDREAWRETREILADKGLMAQLEEADRDWKEGDYKHGDYVEWEKLKKENIRSSSTGGPPGTIKGKRRERRSAR